jgi:hypothetical protein
MPISLSCDCGRDLRVKDELAGRKIRCPACSGVLAVPRPQPATDEDDEIVTVMPVESPAPRPSPAQAIKRAQTSVRPPSGALSVRPQAAVKKPAVPVKRRRASRSRASRRSGPLLVVHREIVAGAMMMIVAAVWFIGALALGRLFFYPPILFVLGIAAIVRGLTGNGD